MKIHVKRLLTVLTVVALSTFMFHCPALSGYESPQRISLIGKIAEVEGQLLRYVPYEQDWAPTVKDTPFGFDDALATGTNGRAEIRNPNNTWIRIDNNTMIHLIKLDNDFTEIDISSGTSRFFNNSSSVISKVTTPFGYVIANPESTFDIYVGSKSVEVVTLQGDLEYVSSEGDSKYEVPVGSPILADNTQVVLSTDTGDPQWEQWNSERNSLILSRLAKNIKGISTDNLPRSLREESYALDENGRWDEVYSESCNCKTSKWRPTKVDTDWQPFTSGRWVEIYGENCWVPDEPFGYVTHHYGNWEYVDGNWYWEPPAPLRAAAVAADETDSATTIVEAAWYPGRVGWFYSDTQIGWFPLARFEPFYARHYWGPQVIVTDTLAVGDDGIDLVSFAYWGPGGVVVEQNNFYYVDNYYKTKITRVNRLHATANDSASKVAAHKYARTQSGFMPKSLTSDRSRFRATSSPMDPSHKPSPSATARIKANKTLAGRSSDTAGSVKSKVTQLPRGKSVNSPVTTSKRPESIAKSKAVLGGGGGQAGSATSNAKPKAVENSKSAAASGSPDKSPAKSVTSNPTRQDNTNSLARTSGRKSKSSLGATRSDMPTLSGSKKSGRSDTPTLAGSHGQSRSDVPTLAGSNKQGRSDTPTLAGSKRQGRSDAPTLAGSKKLEKAGSSAHLGSQKRLGAANGNLGNQNSLRSNNQARASIRTGNSHAKSAPARSSASSHKKK
jgi:hypothetical protein